MSGTSLDGLDLCCVRFSSNLKDFQILESKTVSYTDKWKSKLKNAFFDSAGEIEILDKAFGVFLAEQISAFINTSSLPPIDLIASHGHTIFHDPSQGITKQIGCGEEIAKLTGVKVIYDFRSQDVALGGQGAPLVPIGDAILFHSYDACLNLGGFADFTTYFLTNKTKFFSFHNSIAFHHITKI